MRVERGREWVRARADGASTMPGLVAATLKHAALTCWEPKGPATITTSRVCDHALINPFTCFVVLIVPQEYGSRTPGHRRTGGEAPSPISN
jgi:hypothetical protein